MKIKDRLNEFKEEYDLYLVFIVLLFFSFGLYGSITDNLTIQVLVASILFFLIMANIIYLWGLKHVRSK
jgi:hypothetical protein